MCTNPKMESEPQKISRTKKGGTKNMGRCVFIVPCRINVLAQGDRGWVQDSNRGKKSIDGLRLPTGTILSFLSFTINLHFSHKNCQAWAWFEGLAAYEDVLNAIFASSLEQFCFVSFFLSALFFFSRRNF